ncbi:MAG: sigma-70 family RNA polymerase sigma factor [Pseudomonadota bacterium]
MYLPVTEQPDIMASYPIAMGFNAMEVKAKTAETKTPAVQTVKKPDADSNEALLCAIGEKQDKQAFIELFEYFAPRIKSFLMKSGTAPDQADELAQETMLTVWKKADLYKPQHASASTWIFTIARNKRIDLYRKMSRPEPDPNDPMMVNDDVPMPDDNIDRMREADAMKKALENLPAEQADLIKKSYFEDKTHDAIARETRLPLGTVKSRIRLALERLRKNEEIKNLWPERL